MRRKVSLVMSFILALLSLASCTNNVVDSTESSFISSTTYETIYLTETTETTEETTPTFDIPYIEPYVEDYNGAYGSAGLLGGKTVVVSLFVDDETTSWEGTTEDDKQEMLDMLSFACQWLSYQASEYGVYSEFVYDWNEHPELRMDVSIDYDLINRPETQNTSAIESEYMWNNVDFDSLKETYGADDIIYMIFYNNDEEAHVRSHTFAYEIGETIVNYCPEVVNICRYNEGFYIQGSVIAHEMLHCFGCPDLYVSSDRVSIEYVTILEEDNSQDIMYNGWNAIEFSEVDAYYAGLIDDCHDIHQWYFGPADRFYEAD